MSNNLTASLLFYDIPEYAVTPEGRPYPNPSDRLTEVAVRVNLSVWIVPNHLIPYSLLNEMREAGATWDVVRFDVSEAPHLIEMATRAIAKDILAAVASARNSEATAAANAAKNEDPNKAMVSYLRSCRAIIKKARERVKRLQTAAESFGVDQGRLSLLHAHMGLQGIHAMAETKARLYAEAANRARKLGFNGQAMANAADADELPAGILADYLEDHDVDASALRQAFHVEIYGAAV